MAAINAGYAESVPGKQINRFCSSGLQAIAVAAGRVALGGIETAIAGGVESMSMVPMGGNKPVGDPGLVVIALLWARRRRGAGRWPGCLESVSAA